MMEKLIALIHIINEGYLGECVNENGLDACSYRLVQMFRIMIDSKIRNGDSITDVLTDLNAMKPRNLIVTNLKCEYDSEVLNMIDVDAYSKWIILQAASKVKGVDSMELFNAEMWFFVL